MRHVLLATLVEVARYCRTLVNTYVTGNITRHGSPITLSEVNILSEDMNRELRPYMSDEIRRFHLTSRQYMLWVICPLVYPWLKVIFYFGCDLSCFKLLYYSVY